MAAEPRWNVITPAPRPVPASGPRADPDRNPARVLSAAALANIAAAATVGRGSTQNLAFFAVVAAAQRHVRPSPLLRVVAAIIKTT